MRTRLVVPIALATLAVVAVVAGCKKEEVATDTAATAESVTDTSASATAFSAPSGSVVKVEFEGLVSHILGQNPKRSVLIKNGFHKSVLLVKKPTTIGKDPAESKQRLIDALPSGHTVKCSADYCEVAPLTGLRIRVADGPTGPLQPSPVVPGADFTRLVPGLNHISTMPNVSDILDDDVPSGDFVAFFDLTGGTLSATPYCDAAELKKPNGTSLGEIDFARTVLLTGTTSATAQLQFSDDGTHWKSVVMNRATVINLRIENNPDNAHSGMPHLALHKSIAKNPATVTDFPAFVSVKLCRAGTAVGCSNSAWP